MAHVLIVEDEPDVLLLLENRMRAAGHDVESATDGETALELIAASRPAVIVLDWMMPRVSGIDRAYASGADDYIVKPFSSRDLIERVAALADA